MTVFKAPNVTMSAQLECLAPRAVNAAPGTTCDKNQPLISVIVNGLSGCLLLGERDDADKSKMTR